MTLGQGHDIALEYLEYVWNIIQIQQGSEKLWPDMDFGYVWTVSLTLVQGHDTLLGHGQKWCELLARSNMTVRSYGRIWILGMC